MENTTENTHDAGDLEAILRKHASQQGVRAEEIAQRLLESALVFKPEWGDGVELATKSGEEKARAFAEWARSHRPTPPLSDEAISRASMYPDRL